MPDISMCVDGECPKRMLCHRYTAVPNKEPGWQAYFVATPRTPEGCEHFWDNTGYDKAKGN